MFDSPLSASAYEVLGVDPAVDQEELRRAFRLRLRQTHPDTGGDAAVFIQVQYAWELVGTPESRAAYDRGHGFAAESANIENLDPAFEGLPILRQRADRELSTVMSNSFGFGGTNATLVMSRI